MKKIDKRIIKKLIREALKETFNPSKKSLTTTEESKKLRSSINKEILKK